MFQDFQQQKVQDILTGVLIIRLLAVKPAVMYNFSFLDLFEGRDDIIEKITKLEGTKLQLFLYSFANIIDDVGIDEAVKKVSTLF